MSGALPEPRMAVMILVEASWEDPSGNLQTAPARMENRSNTGACIRLKTRIDVGSQLRVQWRWEQFSGVAKYCHSSGEDFLVGIQKNASFKPLPEQQAAAKGSRPQNEAKPNARPAPAEKARNAPPVQAVKRMEMPAVEKMAETASAAASGKTAVAMSARETGRERRNRDSPRYPWPPAAEAPPQQQSELKQLLPWKRAGKERKRMRNKWFGNDKQEELNGNGNNNGANEPLQAAPQVSRAPQMTRTAEKAVAAPSEEQAEGFQGELLAMEDVYSAAGIMNPRRGYSIHKIVDMLRSEHVRGLAKELRRAAVLMALDAADIPIAEVLQDAKVRQEALDSYAAEQRKQVEAQWARKAEENTQIQAELELVKARYLERIRRNLDGVAREKATFGAWLKLKEQESQSMTEAVELCLKPQPAQEPANTPMPEVSLVSANAKPV